MAALWGLAGALLLVSIAVLCSVDRRKISIRTVGVALLVQVLFGALVLYVPAGRWLLETVSNGFQAVIDTSADGIDFVFGPLLENGHVFALNVLPVIIFFSALTAVLHYLGILPLLVKVVGGAFAKLFGTTTPESMNTAANIFLGQTEAPLVIRHYVKKLSQSEVFAVMTGGMATVAGTVLVGYSLLGVPLEFLIAAAFMAAPGALVMAKLMMPAGAELPAVGEERGNLTARLRRKKNTTADATSAEAASTRAGSTAVTDTDADTATVADADTTSATVTEQDATASSTTAEEDEEEDKPANVIDAAARGASDGLGLALSIGAMLIAFIALIALINLLLGVVGGWFGFGDVTLQQILGWIFAPVMFAIGVPWEEATAAGSFVGQKIVLNEFVAFSEFGPVAGEFTEKSEAIITFALTGFANFAGIAMQLGCLGSLAPNQRPLIARLGMRAVLAGTLANLMSATIAGVMISL